MTVCWPKAQREGRGPGTSLFPWDRQILVLFLQSISSVFSSQPQISSSSINVRVASERLSHLNLPDFLNYKRYLHIIRIYSSVMPKAKATVSTECRASISYKLNTLQFSLFPFFCFTLGFPIMGFALVTPSPNSFAHFKAQACLLSQ